VLTATTPSRGPLESFVPSLTPSPTSPFPTLTLQSHSEKYFSATTLTGSAPTILKSKAELRADADVVGEGEGLRIKCQREFVLKAKMAMEDAKEGKGRTRVEGGPAPGSLEDEMRKKWVVLRVKWVS
jgi:protein FRG1